MFMVMTSLETVEDFSNAVGEKRYKREVDVSFIDHKSLFFEFLARLFGSGSLSEFSSTNNRFTSSGVKNDLNITRVYTLTRWNSSCIHITYISGRDDAISRGINDDTLGKETPAVGNLVK